MLAKFSLDSKLKCCNNLRLQCNSLAETCSRKAQAEDTPKAHLNAFCLGLFVLGLGSFSATLNGRKVQVV